MLSSSSWRGNETPRGTHSVDPAGRLAAHGLLHHSDVRTRGQKKGEKDFRDLLGDAKSKRPIRAGAIVRSQIIKLLGEPPLISDKGDSIGYEFTAVRSVTVYPLCFFISEPSSERRYAVRFEFDRDDLLQSWRTEQEDSTQRRYLFGTSPEFTTLPPLGLRYRDARQGLIDRIVPTTRATH